MIELRDVHKTLGGREILKGMSLKIPDGSTYVIMGPSGIGKSVTLKHVIGILKPDAGEVLVDGQDVGGMDKTQLMALRKNMGYLFQTGALINWLPTIENVALPLRENSNRSNSEIIDRCMEVLKLVGMDHLAAQYPGKLSGGQKLRVGLARALANKPRYVLYDEPNAGLDPIMSDQIHQLICDVRDQLGVTGLVVTHSRACAMTVADRVGVVQDGAVLVEGTFAELQQSENELVRHFVGGGAD